MATYDRIWDDAYNIQAIIERVRKEAEDIESFATMLTAEVEAYYIFKQEYRPYELNMWEDPVLSDDSDFVYIGGVNMTKDDFDNCHFKAIFPISYIDDIGEYRVEYRLSKEYIQNVY